MTTVVIKNGVIAADTGMVRSDILFSGATKITILMHPVHGRMAVGFSGCYDLFQLAYTALATMEEMRYPSKFDNDDQATFLGVTTKGVVYLWTRDYLHTGGVMHGTQGAIGSGQQFALGAMAAGADASEAVHIAALFDPWTNSDVQTIDFVGKYGQTNLR